MYGNMYVWCPWRSSHIWLRSWQTKGHKAREQLHTRGAGRVLGQGGQNSARSAEKFFPFAHPGFQFAHPAHRTEADLREKGKGLDPVGY